MVAVTVRVGADFQYFEVINIVIPVKCHSCFVLMLYVVTMHTRYAGEIKIELHLFGWYHRNDILAMNLLYK
jgi:hypothetical protein